MYKQIALQFNPNITCERTSANNFLLRILNRDGTVEVCIGGHSAHCVWKECIRRISGLSKILTNKQKVLSKYPQAKCERHPCKPSIYIVYRQDVLNNTSVGKIQMGRGESAQEAWYRAASIL